VEHIAGGGEWVTVGTAPRAGSVLAAVLVSTKNVSLRVIQKAFLLRNTSLKCRNMVP
jgi:hypothetical protein